MKKLGGLVDAPINWTTFLCRSFLQILETREWNRWTTEGVNEGLDCRPPTGTFFYPGKLNLTLVSMLKKKDK